MKLFFNLEKDSTVLNSPFDLLETVQNIILQGSLLLTASQCACKVVLKTGLLVYTVLLEGENGHLNDFKRTKLKLVSNSSKINMSWCILFTLCIIQTFYMAQKEYKTYILKIRFPVFVVCLLFATAIDGKGASILSTFFLQIEFAQSTVYFQVYSLFFNGHIIFFQSSLHHFGR